MKMLLANNEPAKKEEAAKETKEDKVLKLLTDIDVCKICAIRVISENSGVAQIYGEYNVDELEVKRGSHCFLCLGILEEFTLCAVAKNIAEKMKDLKYDSPNFQLGVAIPQCLALRQSSMITYLAVNGNVSSTRNFPAVKTVVKFFLLKLIEKFTKKTFYQHSDLFIRLDYIFPDSDIEISKLDSLLLPTKKRKLPDSPGNTSVDHHKTEKVSNVIKRLSDSAVKQYTIYPPQPSAEACEFAVSLHHSSIFFGGRYNKYSRTLSQTWEGGAALEFIGDKLTEFTHGTGIKVISTGREDVDVRILGKGKPFVAEVTDPKLTVFTEEQVAKLQADINSTDTMAVHNLQKVNRAGLDLMRKGEEGKVKTYRAKLWCSEQIPDESIEKLNKMDGIEVKQSTPVRVLHRHPVATHVKKIHEVELKRADEDEHYELNLKVPAGTYINEFVHGDLGRTEPSLKTLLGVPVDVVELDFMSINLNWPPEVECDADSNGGESKNDNSKV